MDQREEELYFRAHGLLGIKTAAELNAMLEDEQARQRCMDPQQFPGTVKDEHGQVTSDKGSKGADRDR